MVEFAMANAEEAKQEHSKMMILLTSSCMLAMKPLTI